MTVGCAGVGISDTGGSLIFSGFASGEIKICLSFVRFGVIGLIKRLFLNVILFDLSRRMVLVMRKDFHHNPCLDPTSVPF